MKNLLSMVAIGLLAACPGVAQTSGLGFFERFAALEEITLVSSGLRRGPRAESHERLLFGWEDHALEVDGALIEYTEEGALLTMDEVFLSHQEEDGGALRLQGVEILLASDGALTPRRGAPLACRYIGDILSMTIDDTRVVPGTLAGFSHSSLEIRDLEIIPDPTTRCLDLEVLAGSVIGTRNSGYSWTLSGVSLRTDLPDTRADATSGKGLSRLVLAAKRSTFQFPDTVRFFILNDSRIDLQMVSRDLVPAFLSFDTRLLMAPQWRETSILMDMWNIAMLLRGRADIAVDNAQILATHIVPTYLTANFRNAGLSSIPGRLDARIDLDKGRIALMSDLEFAGLANIGIDADLLGLLLGSEVLSYADRGRITLADVPPDARISNFRMTWLDQGFEARFSDLLGLPPGSWFELFSEQEGIRFSDTFKAMFSGYPPIASRFFRAADYGKEVVITLATSDAPGLGDVISSVPQGPGALQQIFPLDYD